ncbi:hypothetical protein Pla111_17270 [Botrimarina hoheduenensis]|uniref:Glycosyl transferases group 1 n=1 Tax=Botrimarina hoheduenensis TaxID=2528000 RepID=A0A5C5W6W7_9BACT|nr:hypothetical protein Pla111_17270 [Botrimarina hoheduenensis]
MAVQTNDPMTARFLRQWGTGTAVWGHVVRSPQKPTTTAERADCKAAAYEPTATESSEHGYLPNAAECVSLTEAERIGYRERFELGTDSPLVVMCLRLDNPTAVKEAVWAADLLRVVAPGSRLVVVGEGPVRLAAERFAAAATEPGTVRFVGPRHDALRLVAAADVVWAPQAQHAGATPVVEARMVGCPVVFGWSRSPTGSQQATATPEIRAVEVTDRAGWVRETLAVLQAKRVGANDQDRASSPLAEHLPARVVSRRDAWLGI